MALPWPDFVLFPPPNPYNLKCHTTKNPLSYLPVKFLIDPLPYMKFGYSCASATALVRTRVCSGTQFLQLNSQRRRYFDILSRPKTATFLGFVLPQTFLTFRSRVFSPTLPRRRRRRGRSPLRASRAGWNRLFWNQYFIASRVEIKNERPLFTPRDGARLTRRRSKITQNAHATALPRPMSVLSPPQNALNV